jgi:hypothetical protein
MIINERPPNKAMQLTPSALSRCVFQMLLWASAQLIAVVRLLSQFLQTKGGTAMPLGFQTWKDIIEVLIVPLSLAIIALFWPELQLISRRRSFTSLILRELQELKPYPKIADKDMHWWEHQTKDFIHQKIFREASENRDFILSLPPDLVYFVTQLWDAKNKHNSRQWLHFLEELSDPKYDKTGRIKEVHKDWQSLILQYEKLGSGLYNL